ncbi:hypothetical protein [Nocardia mangyaensis]|uniref:hypothetical protein n=1 Tax=Nocardia mangyaensis TaxID=2213200 RepID=UPI0026760E35|nr:hypothetical protein [Nocardia mangyaensis]MDO3649376.1 hypothetical protein [Nocardia mangyaensis]
MVSSHHEAMHRIFRHDPGTFARVFHALDLPFPDPLEVEHLSVDLTEIEPIERRADTVLRIVTAESSFLLVVEAQNKRDDTRPGAWAYYLAFLHAKYTIPVVLVVVCRNRTTANWAQGPLSIGHATWPCVILHPLVLGPHNVPAITDVQAAATDLPLAALSAITHATRPEIGAILEALSTALHLVGERDDAQIYTELVELGLGRTRGAQIWRNLMSIDLSFFRGETAQRLREEGREKGHEEGRKEGREEGHEQGVADSIVRILRRRGLDVPTSAEEKITACRDLAQLTDWLDRSISARTVDDLFAD